MILNKFKCNKKELVHNGEVFYFNGQNGSVFDWYSNGHTSTLATLYFDGTEAVKIHIYQDGKIVAYYYKKGSVSPDETINTKIIVNKAKKIANLLYVISDCKGLFDKKLSLLDLNYTLSDTDISKFDNEINY